MARARGQHKCAQVGIRATGEVGRRGWGEEANA